MKPDSQGAAPRRQLNLFDTISIIVGIVIGTGIYQTTPAIASAAPSSLALIGLWVAGGVLSLIGALCFAELTTMYPQSGGDYVFLSKAYGRPVGFLFAWSEFFIVRTGNVGLMAIIFGNYASQLVPLRLDKANPHYDHLAYAVVAVVVLTTTNALGVRVGKATQNVLTSIKVISLGAIFVLGMTLVSPQQEIVLQPVSKHITLFTAAVLVFFTYGGWSEMSFVAAEVRDPERNIVRSLIGGTLLIMVIYVLLNLTFVKTMGLQGLRDSQAIASDVMRLAVGDFGGRFVSLLVCLSCLGAINGMLFTGARIFYASGTEHPLAAVMGKWNARFDAPVRSLVGQGCITLILLGTLGLYSDGFIKLVNFTAPVFWFFKLLVALSIFVLRARDPNAPRPGFALFPVLPIVFAITCLFVIYSSALYAWNNQAVIAIVAFGIVAAGIPVAIYPGRRPRQTGEL